MARTRRYTAMPLSVLVARIEVMACAITSPVDSGEVAQGDDVEITGTISEAGTVQVFLGATLLGVATVVGLAWSYTWTPAEDDIGEVVINATATPLGAGPVGYAASVFVTVLEQLEQSFAAAELLGTHNAAKFTCVDGVGGAPPQFAAGSTIICVVKQAVGAGSSIAQFGLLGSNRGWSFGTTASNNPAIRYYGSAQTSIGATQAAVWGRVNCIAVASVGGNFRASTNGSNVEVAVAPAYTPAAAGDTFQLGFNEEAGTAGAAALYGFVVLDRAMSDAELKAVSNIGVSDNRYDLSSLLLDANCKLYWSAKDSWDGSAATSLTQGSSPLTLTKTGAPTRTAFTEVRQKLSATQFQDSAGELIVGTGLNEKRIHAEYAKTAFVAASTELDIDIVGNGSVLTLDLYINGAYSAGIPSSQLRTDNTRTTYRQAVTIGQSVEVLDGFHVGVGGLPTQCHVIQAVRYRASAPWTLKSYANITRRLVILGDSIVGGFGATWGRDAWGRKIHDDVTYPGRVTFLAYGSARLSDYYAGGVPALGDKMFTAMNQLSPTIRDYWIELGTNELVADAPWIAFYESLCDYLHTVDPTARVFCQSPTVTTAEPASLIAMRTAIGNIAAARPTFCTYVNGLTLATVGQLSDTVHLSSAGHASAFTAIKPILGY